MKPIIKVNSRYQFDRLPRMTLAYRSNAGRVVQIAIFGFIAALIIAFGSPARAQSPTLAGHWQGVMEREGAAMAVRFDFEAGPGGVEGRFTSESQRALSIRSTKSTMPHRMRTGH